VRQLGVDSSKGAFMFTLWGNTNYSMCDGLSRRDFIRLGSLGIGALGGISLADVLRLRAHGADRPRSSQKSVIMVYLPGGPTHLDTFDLKPDAPDEVRGNYKPIATKVVGMRICEHLPRLASVADKFSLIRTLKFAGPHEPHELVTGVSFTARSRRPSFGSVLSRIRGNRATLPPYISLGYWTVGGGGINDPEYPAYLGSAHWPFRPGSSSKLEKKGTKDDLLGNLTLPSAITKARLDNRKALRQAMDRLHKEMDDPQGTLASVDGFTGQVLEMLSSAKARDAFDINREPAKTREKYGEATNLLLARRLVEAGVSVVTVPLPGGSWDDHQDIYTSGRLPKKLPILDHGIHGLITDLHERGLDKDVSVVVWGEFGRRPLITQPDKKRQPGRDHWPENGFALLFGGGLKVGQVVGETDARVERAKTRPLRPSHVLATLYHALGIDPAMTFPDFSGRPTYLLDDRDPIEELL
jgi:hypothetical protein